MVASVAQVEMVLPVLQAKMRQDIHLEQTVVVAETEEMAVWERTERMVGVEVMLSFCWKRRIHTY